MGSEACKDAKELRSIQIEVSCLFYLMYYDITARSLVVICTYYGEEIVNTWAILSFGKRRGSGRICWRMSLRYLMVT